MTAPAPDMHALVTPPTGSPKRGAINVVLVDLPPLLDYGIRCLLQADPTMVLYADDALAQVGGWTNPSVAVLWDITVAPATLRRLQAVACLRTLALSMSSAHRSGEALGIADAVLRTDATPLQLVNEVRSLATTGTERDESSALPVQRLTPRELEVLALVQQRRTNDEIAQELVLARQTVKNYVLSIMTKLGCSQRSRLYRDAHRVAS